jgi:hypothetical protein
VRGLLFFFLPREVRALHLEGMTTGKRQDINLEPNWRCG